MSSQPRVVILAGPNGAGKSTASQLVIRDELAIRDFVNADTIARGLSAFDVESVALESGRIMLDRLKKLATARKDFAFETTLASRTFAPWIRELKETGYRFTLIYLWLKSSDESVRRVSQRVSLGGHDIPTDTIHRRYAAGLSNFFRLYMPLADEWRLYDNSAGGAPRKVVSYRSGHGEIIEQPETWEQIKMSQNPGSVQESEVPYGQKKEVEEDRILIALKRAGRQVMITHKKMGWPLVDWQDGKVVTVQPEDIVIPPEV